MEVSGQLWALVALYPETKSDSYCIGGLVGPRAGVDVSKKIKISFLCRDSKAAASNP
jgi:hypothetical protein